MSQLDWYIRANLKPRHLQLLVAMDDLRHLGRVAQSLHVSQPAISLALGELEKGLGFKLFERTPKGVTPNAFGDCVIRQARVVLSNLAQMRDELHALQSGTSGKIQVGAMPAMTPSLLPMAIARFKQKTPQVSIILQESSMDALLPDLRRGTLDLIVGRLLNRNVPDDLSEESLYDGRNVLVVGRKHPLAARRKLNWASLAPFPWVLPPRGSLSRDPLEKVLQENGCAMPADYVETLSIHVITGYLQQSLAIGVLSKVVARHYVQTGMLRQLPLAVPDAQRPIGITWNRHKPLSLSTQAFLQCLRESAAAANMQ
jgi:DNA-binding transcriptional LysR family regulator